MSVIRNSAVVTYVFAVSFCVSASPRLKMLWQGVVKPEAINVYASASTSERVTGTLKQGDVVEVVLQITTSTGDSWCRVERAGASEPLGFVLCFNLERGNSTAKQIAQAEPAAAPPRSTATVPAPSGVTSISGALTNSDILDMNKAGLPPNVLVAKIKASQCAFDTSATQLKQLKAEGVNDAVILAMVEAPTEQPKSASPADNTPSVVASAIKTTQPDVLPKDGKMRVLVTDSQSWETRGGSSAGGNRNGWGASSWISGGARPQTAEIIKTLNERCPEITVTNNLPKADYVLTLDHEGGKSLLAHRNKVAVFNRDGDVIFSASTRELGNSVKDACQAMLSSKR
jgi:hypothetical protein